VHAEGDVTGDAVLDASFPGAARWTFELAEKVGIVVQSALNYTRCTVDSATNGQKDWKQTHC